MFIVDSHCHLDALNYDSIHQNIDDVLNKAKANDVQHLLAVSVNLSRFSKAYKLLNHYDSVSLSCGVHPLDVNDEPFNYEKLLELASLPKVVAIGETGLDYYYSIENKSLQQQIFTQQITAANLLNKPLIIHTRGAKEDTMQILIANQADKCGGVMHCFTETKEMAKQALEIGFYISISGIVTFKNAEQIRDVVRYVPTDRLLIETDSPYLAPIPYRGKENQPAYVRNVCEYVATLKGLSTQELALITTKNFQQLFKLNLI